MKYKLLSILAALTILTSLGAQAVPEEDRIALANHYKQLFPNIKLEDYVFGALAMNPEAKEQYDSVMEFPPFAGDVRQGGVMWETAFKNGERFSSCFKYEGNNAAASFPYFDDKTNRVVTFENAINDCLKLNNEKEIKYGSKDMAILTAYAKSLSDKAKVSIKIRSAGALAAYEKGKSFYYQRQGKLNFSCSICHVDYAGRFARSEQLSMMIGQASHWPEFRAGTEPVTLQGRFIQCQKNTGAEPKEANSPEYNNLEFYMTYMSNGLKMQTPVFRK